MVGSYLVKRDRYWHFRFRVPCDLTNTLGKRELHKSLRLRERTEALKYGRRLASEIERTLAALRMELAHRRLSDPLDDLTAPHLKRLSSLLGGSEDRRSGHTVASSIAAYIDERKARWAPKTVLAYEQAMDLLRSELGSKSLEMVTRANAVAFQNRLARTPANLAKRYPGLTLTQVLTLDPLPVPMSATTANKLLSIVSGFFKWAMQQGLLRTNPFRGLGVSDSRRPDTERDAFTPEELKLVFSHEQYREQSARWTSKQWLPYVALFSGLRLEEACQLKPNDIRTVDGVWIFDIRAGDGRHLKTAASNRIVPIHSKLIEIGFVQYVAQVRDDGHSQLWPDLKRGADGLLSSAYSKWFSRFKRAAGIANSRIVFHSFRHTFINELKQGGAPEAAIKQLVGHVDSSITTGRYGKTLPAPVLSRSVELLSFDL
jgi:integrase